MKVVVLNGSPHLNGYTMQLVNKVFEDYQGTIKVYHAYQMGINPCIGCNYCFENENDCIYKNKDQFFSFIEDIAQADLFVLASSLNFSTFTGQLLSVISRMQYLFGIKYIFKHELPLKNKKGLTIITAGNNYPSMFTSIEPIDNVIHSHLNVKEIKRLLVNKTDRISIDDIFENYKEEIETIKEYIKAID
jgi:multimeric flavodoxin WrbA